VERIIVLAKEEYNVGTQFRSDTFESSK